jgi:3-hydroxyisobutyrate dehydrogenase
MRVGFVGLGNMGGPMAANIAKAGFDLAVFDLREEALAEMEALGARRAASLGDLVASVDLLCVCVLHDAQLRELYFGPQGIIANARQGLLTAIHSTVPPATVLEIDAKGRDAGMTTIDAPVSGARDGSLAGALTIMVGAGDEALAQARPVFEAMGSNIFHVGDVGAGQVVKLGNNLMALANALVAMEAARLASAYGVKRDALFDVARVSSGASRAIDRWDIYDRYGAEHMLAGTEELSHQLAKDLRYAVSAATERRETLPIVALCSQLLPAMFAERWRNGASET